MADPLLVTCPECDKRMKVPAELAGKRIRCKGCEHVIAVPAGKVKGNSADTRLTTAAPPPPAAPPPLPAAVEVEDDGKTPFGLVETNLAPRCPHCANELDPPDAKVCLHCGYDLKNRRRVERRVTIEHTFADYLLWHGPAVLGLLGVVLNVGLLYYYHVYFPRYVFGKKWDEAITALETESERMSGGTTNAITRAMITSKVNGEDGYLAGIFHPGVELWLLVPSLWLAWKAFRFAFIRFILKPVPPDKVVSS